MEGWKDKNKGRFRMMNDIDNEDENRDGEMENYE